MQGPHFEQKDANKIKSEDIYPQRKHEDKKKLHIHYHWAIRPSEHEPREGFYTMEETICKLGNVGRTVDIFKVNFGNCKLGTVDDWFPSPIHVQQLFVKVHTLNEKSDNFFQAIKDAGYIRARKEKITAEKAEALRHEA